MDRLRQALDAPTPHDGEMYGCVRCYRSELCHEREIRDAARLVLEGERVWWCETHKEHRRFGFPTCWEWGVLGGFGPPCRMVERLLTEVPEDKEE